MAPSEDFSGADQATSITAIMGWTIHRKRIALGYTASVFAGKLGLSSQQLRHYERGKRTISFRMLARMSQILGCEVGELVKDIDLCLPKPNIERDQAIASEIGDLMLEGFWSLGSPDRRHDMVSAMNAVARFVSKDEPSN